jgi:hypothetical protein
MRRTVRIDFRVEVIVDDDHDGIPHSQSVMAALLVGASKIPGVTEIKPGAKFTIGLTRESFNELRRRNRIQRVAEKRSGFGRVQLKHGGGYDPRKGRNHPDNQDPTLEDKEDA